MVSRGGDHGVSKKALTFEQMLKRWKKESKDKNRQLKKRELEKINCYKEKKKPIKKDEER